MNEPHDPNRTVDVPSDPPDSLDAGLAVGVGRPADGPGSVLARLRDSLGDVRPVLLREAQGESAHVVKPKSDAMPPAEQTGDRYQLQGEIARGGMGAVLRGRDVDLGRDLAVKVLLEKHAHRPEVARRFIEEAQISGQLQHPGVVPVYDIGRFGDLPFFTMKLVKGQTLAALLRDRADPAAARPRLLAIALQVAQTLAYAHAKGVIHRDLKPANIMVGAFGEVQVMDWGLAKVLAEGGIADEERASRSHQEAEDVTKIRTARSTGSAGGFGTETEAGSLLGTPAYMPPEQANGDVALLDRRADVFGLGAILCEILTGKPPYVGRSAEEVRRKAANGDQADTTARLDSCGADPELIALAKACLSPEAIDRPNEAHAVADRLASYFNGVQERALAAERERAVAVARAIEERRRRRVQLALAASVLAFIILGGLSTTFHFQQRAERDRQRTEQAAAVNRVVDRAVTLRDQAAAHPENLSRWQAALTAVEQVEVGEDTAAHDRLLTLRTEIQAGLVAAERDRALLDRLVEIRSAEADDWDGSATDTAYAGAFREARIDLAKLAPAEAGAKIKARPPSVALSMTAALDDWAAIRRGRRRDAVGAALLTRAAQLADSDPWRNELRAAMDQADPEVQRTALQLLARKAKFEELDPISLQLLGSGLDATGDRVLAESVLRKAQQRHPRDVWVNYELGKVLQGLSRLDEAIRFYTAARAIRPETAHELSHALASRGDIDEAIAVFCDLVVQRPQAIRHLVCLSGALKGRDRSPEVAAALAQAVAAQREAVRLQPDSAEVHANLGIALALQGKLYEAIVEFRTVQRLEPNRRVMWEGRGVISIDGRFRSNRVRMDTPNIVIAELSDRLGKALRDQGQLDDAIAAYRESIRVVPGYAEAYCDLGATLARTGDYAGALQMYRKGHELGIRSPEWPYPSAQWVARAERELALAPRLPALLRGEDNPRDNTERLVFAHMAKHRRHYVLATRLWAEALAADPGLANDLKEAHRYAAACAAALAAAGQAEDAASLDDRERIRLRKQALAWLRADLALMESSQTADTTTAHQALRRWQEDSELTDLRETAALTKLPAEERAAFSQLWADMATLVKKDREQERTQWEASALADRDIASGRTQDAVVHLAALSAARPDDTLLFAELAALQAWFGQEKELAATCRRGLAWAKNTTDPVTAERVAKGCCLLPSTEKAQLEAVLALARKAVQLGKASHHGYLPYFLMALGMAEYRSGHFAEAEAALLAAANSGPIQPWVAATMAFYRAMSLFRQGKEKEARQLAIEAIASMDPFPQDEKNPLTGEDANHNNLILWLAYKEAKAVIQFDPTVALQKAKETLQKAQELQRMSAAATRKIASGRTQEALVHLAALFAANPEDTILFLKLAALQAWFGQEKELAATGRRGLELAKNATDPVTADRVVKACCLLPSTEKAQLEAVLALGRKAVQLGKDSQVLPWYRMTLGIAEYRSGHFAEADAELIAAANSPPIHPYVFATSALYRAMSLFRQGKKEEARQMAIKAASKMRPLPQDEMNPLVGIALYREWNNDLIFWLAYKEAKALIQFEAPRAAPAVALDTRIAILELEAARKAASALQKDTLAEQRVRTLKRLQAALRKTATTPELKEELQALDSRIPSLDQALDREYLATMPPFQSEKFAGRKSRSARTVVMELFTGAQCGPCAAADLGFDGLKQTYGSAEVVLLQYHLHIPRPDPLVNPDAVARAAYYEVHGTPSGTFSGGVFS